MKKSIVNKNFIRTALSLAIPIAIQNLLTSSATLIDTAMVTGLGEFAISALGVATRFSFLLNVICFGFASGAAALLSQYWGAKEEGNIKKTFGFNLSISLCFAFIYAILLFVFPKTLVHIFTDDKEVIRLGSEYLKLFSLAVPFLVFSQVMCISFRSIERVKIPFISSGISVLVNLFFNYCLIHGNLGFPALGLKGAAIGSILGYISQTIFLFIALMVTKTPFKGKFKEIFAFSKGFVAKYLKIAMPVLINEILWAVGTNTYVTVIARQGAINHAGYTLYENIQQVCFVFFVGICSACSVMVGKSVGNGEHERAYKEAKWFAIATPILGAVLGMIMIVLRNPILSLFPIQANNPSDVDAIRKVASNCLLFYSFWVGMRNIPYTLVCGIFRAGGDTKSGLLIDAVNLYGLGIPAVVVTGLLLKTPFIVIIMAMFIFEDTIKSIWCIRHFKSKKWIKQITDKKN
ncbi:MAG: MATE family efflux transporter [Clostridiales bacterium]|nr:MATE family efflux transporter [Clostridiales bacterium]